VVGPSSPAGALTCSLAYLVHSSTPSRRQTHTHTHTHTHTCMYTSGFLSRALSNGGSCTRVNYVCSLTLHSCEQHSPSNAVLPPSCRFKRTPYLSGPTADLCQFVGIADLGNAQKEKDIYAINLVPLSQKYAIQSADTRLCSRSLFYCSLFYCDWCSSLYAAVRSVLSLLSACSCLQWCSPPTAPPTFTRHTLTHVVRYTRTTHPHPPFQTTQQTLTILALLSSPMSHHPHHHHLPRSACALR
jgi:hypothetical protein